MSRTPEALVEREVLLALGRDAGVILLKNEVGNVYRLAVAPALDAALQPFGPLAQAAARSVLQRNRLVVGLGKGSPDLVGSVDGRAIGLELKSPTGRVEPHQATWHEAARRRGAFVAVVRSGDEAVDAVSRCRRGAQ